MIFTGTAAELAELTRKWWGSEWWPKGLEYFHTVTWFPNNGGGWFTHDDSAHVQDDHAASIIFAAAYFKLANDGWGPQLFPPVDWRPSFVVKLANELVRRSEGPSPLHAVLAAVEVVG